MNQTQIVKSAINTFIIIAVCISLFQQFKHSGYKNPNIIQSSSNNSTSTQPLSSQLSGPKIQGIKIFSSDKFQNPIKQILIRNQYNVQMTQYQFQGNEYYLSLLCNWGHMILIYLLMNKYKTQTNQSTKKKIMIGGAIAVIAWFYVSGVIKPQRYSIQVQGRKQLDRDYVDQKQIIDILSVYQLQFDDLNESNKLKGDNLDLNIKAKDAWPSENQNQQNDNSRDFKQIQVSSTYQEQDPIF